jgi:hypothetical protein
MILHQSQSLFRNAIRMTSDRMKLPASFIEKDYWVCVSLYTIFDNKLGHDIIFKGGTALSKCFHLIERFSEDIDLIVLKNPGDSESTLKSKLKRISNLVATILPEVTTSQLTHKMGMHRKTVHAYPQLFPSTNSQTREHILIESSWLGNHEPSTHHYINSFVGQTMLELTNEEFIQEHLLAPFLVKSIDPTRTICEKIMSLVRFSHTANPIENLKNKIRHAYDLHQLLKELPYELFFYSNSFEILMNQIGEEDFIRYRNNNDWLLYHPSEAILFKDLSLIWPMLKVTYQTDFKNLVYGYLPDETEIYNTLDLIKERLRLIPWKIGG